MEQEENAFLRVPAQFAGFTGKTIKYVQDGLGCILFCYFWIKPPLEEGYACGRVQTWGSGVRSQRGRAHRAILTLRALGHRLQGPGEGPGR